MSLTSKAAENLRRVIATVEENLNEAEKDGNHELEYALHIYLDALYAAKPDPKLLGKLTVTLDLSCDK